MITNEENGYRRCDTRRDTWMIERSPSILVFGRTLFHRITRVVSLMPHAMSSLTLSRGGIYDFPRNTERERERERHRAT